MMRATPFARAQAMMALISAALASGNAQAALAGIGPYVSRGKGRGKGRGKAFDKQHHGNHSGARYLPHQGAKEFDRRVNQMKRGML